MQTITRILYFNQTHFFGFFGKHSSSMKAFYDGDKYKINQDLNLERCRFQLWPVSNGVNCVHKLV